MASPIGTVTFLFTDIEGSTRLWEERPEAMQVALARHDAVVRSSLEEHGGHVFKTIGDAFCAAFETPQAALLAALGVHRALLADPDLAVEGERLRVRMALHSGTAQARGGDYFGLSLSRTARLLAAAHGGQILLSGAAHELVRDSLPAGASLRDLGEHRLKDLTRPEQVFQLTAAGTPGEFPPLRTLDARRHNLPVQPTELIGRETEIREITVLLRQRELRLLTLSGPGGIGKTRLALQAASEVADAFADGVFFVDLAPHSDPALLPSAIAQVLGVREGAERTLTETLPEYLQEKRVLLVLDNFEQLASAAGFVARLLAAAAGLKVVVTSRVPLHLRGEQEYPVPPLSLPDPSRLPPPGRLVEYEAVRLFIERAQAVKPDFRLSPENARAVAEICHRLDGLPLALELAAARSKILTPQAILSRLRSRLKLLTGGARDLPERQQTLRGAIEWSYDLLDEQEKRIFRWLAIFSGGATLEAVEQVCGAQGGPSSSAGEDSSGPGQGRDVLEAVASLVDRSLLRQLEDAAGEPRFSMLETIAEYAREKLAGSEETEEVGRRHTDFFLALAEQAEPQLAGAEQRGWLSRLEEEHDNLRAALARTVAQGEFESAGRLAGALRVFWYVRGHLREGRQWLGQVLAGDRLSPSTRAKALYGAGVLAWQQGDAAAAEPFLLESLALCRELADTRGIAWALTGLGILAADRGDNSRAEALYEEALARYRELGEQGRMAAVLNNLGIVAAQQQDHARAESLFQESLGLARRAEHATQASVALLNLGYMARRQEDLPRAQEYAHQSLRLARELGLVQWATNGMAFLAQVLGAGGEPERAAYLFGAVEARFAALGSHVQAPDRAEYDRDLSAVRAQLEPAAWERRYQEGAAWSLEEAIAYALEEVDPSSA